MDDVAQINDPIRVGETAVRAYIRGTRKLQRHIEPMALGLAEAKGRYPVTRQFSEWLDGSPYGELGKNDRAALIRLGQNWSADLNERIAALTVASPQLIVAQLYSSSDDRNSDEDSEDEDDEGDSGFYGSERRVRSNEAWDTIDPRLVQVLVAAIPELRSFRIWEPAAGSGLMVAQIEESGCKVQYASDIEPRGYGNAQDFFAVQEMPLDVDAIVTNPPWGRLAADFVRHALALALPRRALVAMLLPLPWITARGIADLTGSAGFDQIIVPRFRARWMTEDEETELAVQRRAKNKPGNVSPKMNHVWLVWNFDREAVEPIIVFADTPDEAGVVAAEAADRAMPGQLSLFRGPRQRGRKPPPTPEYALHCLVADTLRRWLDPNWCAFHVPNGEKRDPATAGRLKRMLVSPGVSDFILFGPGARIHALELKRRGEKPNAAQKAFLEAVRTAGGEAAWTDSYERALGVLKGWGAVPDRVVLVENGDIVVRRASA